MGQEQNIDNLFKDALHGATSTEAYSESAWKGANALLNKHYRILLFKKLALIALPIVIAAVSISFYLLESDVESQKDQSIETAHTISPLKTESQQSIIEEDIKAVNTSEAMEEIANLSSPSLTKEEIRSNAENPVSKNEREEAAPAHTLNFTEAPHSSENDVQLAAASTTTKNAQADLTSPSILAAETAAKNVIARASNSLDWMPTFKVGRLAHKDFAGSVPARSKPSHEDLMQTLRRIELGFSAGGLVTNGFQNVAQKNPGLALGMYAGLTVSYHVNARLFVSTGLIFHERSRLSSRTFVENTPAGSVYSNAQHLTYIDIPIQIGYNAGARHSMVFGMSFSPLIGYLPSTEVQSESQNTEPVITRENGLQREGFANFDVAGALGYRYQLTRRLDLSVDLRFGLFDVTDNQYFNTGLVDDRNHQLRIGVNYRIINR